MQKRSPEGPRPPRYPYCHQCRSDRQADARSRRGTLRWNERAGDPFPTPGVKETPAGNGIVPGVNGEWWGGSPPPGTGITQSKKQLRKRGRVYYFRRPAPGKSNLHATCSARRGVSHKYPLLSILTASYDLLPVTLRVASRIRIAHTLGHFTNRIVNSPDSELSA